MVSVGEGGEPCILWTLVKRFCFFPNREYESDVSRNACNLVTTVYGSEKGQRQVNEREDTLNAG